MKCCILEKDVWKHNKWEETTDISHNTNESQQVVNVDVKLNKSRSLLKITQTLFTRLSIE
jgi:hypothetical protein